MSDAGRRETDLSLTLAVDDFISRQSFLRPDHALTRQVVAMFGANRGH
jgi:hypothetical protein